MSGGTARTSSTATYDKKRKINIYITLGESQFKKTSFGSLDF